MARLTKRCLVTAGVVIAVGMSFCLGDRTIVEPPKIPEDILPFGAKVVEVKHRSQIGKVLFQQPAKYRSDMDGDGELETVILFSKSVPADKAESLYIAVFKMQKSKTSSLKEAVLVEQVELPGTYLWKAVGDRSGFVTFMDVDNDGKTEFYCATAIGASPGARLSLLSYGKKKGVGEYALTTWRGSFHYLRAADKVFRVRHKSEKAWTTLSIMKGKDGSFRFDRNDR